MQNTYPLASAKMVTVNLSQDKKGHLVWFTFFNIHH